MSDCGFVLSSAAGLPAGPRWRWDSRKRSPAAQAAAAARCASTSDSRFAWARYASETASLSRFESGRLSVGSSAKLC
eukprot:1247975-Prymnesium_polylepis.1